MIKFIRFIIKNREKIVEIVENYDNFSKKESEKPKKERYSVIGVPKDQITELQNLGFIERDM